MNLPARGLALAVAIVLTATAQLSGQSPKRVKAVGQAAGTGTEDFALVKDRILSQAGGYVREWEEVRRWVDGGVTNVEIEAIVLVADFERDWAAFAHLKEDEGNPRMMVVIIEDNDVDDLKPPVLHGVCQSRIEHFFLDKDVQLMDKTVSEQVRERDVSQAALDNDVTKLAAIAAEFKAEVLVFGRAEAKRGGTVALGGHTLYGWDVTLNIRAVQADSAAILMSNTYRP
ncbi:MAG: hypothetical protein ACYSUI_25500, partial [Planctomycetota bacterium]